MKTHPLCLYASGRNLHILVEREIFKDFLRKKAEPELRNVWADICSSAESHSTEEAL